MFWDHPLVMQVWGYVEPGWTLAMGWLLSPAAWSQFGLLVVAWVLAVLATRIVAPRLTAVLTPPEGAQSPMARSRRFVLIFMPLLLPLFAYAFTALGEQVTRSLFGSGAVIAFGKRIFLFVAARILVRDIITIPFLNSLGRFVLVPVAALYAVGLLGPVEVWLTETVVGVGNIRFSLMSIVRGVIAGSILFWLGGGLINRPPPISKSSRCARRSGS